MDIDDVDVHSSLASNGGFESGVAPWAAYPGTNSNFVRYHNGDVSGESARDGVRYGATNTSSSGGGIYEDVPLSASPGNLYCASAWVRTQVGSSSAGSGQFAVWLLDGSYNENGVASFSGLGSGSSWRQVQACVAASTAHDKMRIQLYPKPGGPTVDIDDVDVHSSLASNGGFESGVAPWAAYPGTNSNFVRYHNGDVSGESARDGVRYGATNTSSSGGGIYEDVPLSASPGNLYCASAWVRTQVGSSSAGSGQFAVWLLDGSYNENGVASFSGLGSGSSWRQVQACVAASTAHDKMRIQLYPKPGGPTVDVDDVDVH